MTHKNDRVLSVKELVPPGVELVVTDGEPTRLIEAWTGAALAVVVDAVRAQPPHPPSLTTSRMAFAETSRFVRRPRYAPGYRGALDRLAFSTALR